MYKIVYLPTGEFVDINLNELSYDQIKNILQYPNYAFSRQITLNTDDYGIRHFQSRIYYNSINRPGVNDLPKHYFEIVEMPDA